MITRNRIDKIINANEVHEEERKELFNIYKDDYRNKYHNLIKNRLYNAIYIFDSTPDITYKFALDNKEKITNRKFLERTQLEYEDYKSKKRELKDKTDFDYYKKVCKLLGISSKENMNKFTEIVNIPLKDISSRNHLLIEHSNLPVEIKKELSNKEKECLSILKRIGIKNKIKRADVDKILNIKETNEYKNNINLVKNTIWGKRIQMFIQKNTTKYISNEAIARIMFSNESGTTNMFPFDYPVSIVHIPLIDSIGIYSLDSIYLHESRHVIETDIFGTGLAKDKEMYTIVNEINTEKNGFEDGKKVAKEIIDNSIDIAYGSAYADLFDLCGSFYEDFHPLLNESAVRVDEKIMEDAFGKENFKRFATALNINHEILREYYNLEMDCPITLNPYDAPEQIEKMYDNFSKKLLIKKRNQQNPNA